MAVVLGSNVSGAGTTELFNQLSASHVTAAANATTATIHAYVKETDGIARKILLGIYSDDAGNNEPATLLAAAVDIDVPANHDGEVSGAYVATLVASTKYWFGLKGNNDSVLFYLTASQPANTQNYKATTTYALPDPYPDDGLNFTNLFSVWAESASGVVVPISVITRRRRG